MAAILLLPSIKVWFFVIKYKKLAAFSSIVEYKSLPSKDWYIVPITSFKPSFLYSANKLLSLLNLSLPIIFIQSS